MEFSNVGAKEPQFPQIKKEGGLETESHFIPKEEIFEAKGK